MTWTAAVETNLDFEANGTGWNPLLGTAQWVAWVINGGNIAFKGGAAQQITVIDRVLAIPADSKLIRLTAWLGRDATDDESYAAIRFPFVLISERR